MHVSRDRLPRPIDISSLLQTAERRVDLVVDEPGLHRMGLSTQNSSTGQSGCANGKVGLPSVRLQKIRQRQRVNRSLAGKENRRPKTLRKGQGSGRGSVLPSWYPRTPLRDITAIVRAIEKKRAELHGDQTMEASSSSSHQQEEADGLEVPNNKLERGTNNPKPESEASKATMNGNADQNVDFFTPQKKLLNSIEKVRQVWLEDQRKQERTPSAKKAERQKMVRVLMSMR